MSIGYIDNSYHAENIWDISGVTSVEGGGNTKDNQKVMSSSGDTVEISSAARAMYEKMIARHGIATSNESETGSDSPGESFGNNASAPIGGNDGIPSSSDEDSIDEKIEALESQLIGLAQQVGRNGADSAIESKMNAIQSQIAALEAEKNQLKASK